MSIKHQALSWYRLRVIDLQRVTDHIWRRIAGVPTLRRSMITPQLYLGGQHSRRRGLHFFKRWGITAIVNMRTRSLDLSKEGWIKTLHLPTPDLHAPTIAQLKQGVAFIDDEIEQGGKVYIHCAHGEGRGPTMIIAYLISTGLTYQDAFALVKKVRTFIRPTRVQIQRLLEFAKLQANAH
ncbi:MAG TPA: dual specificity protein phosphatase [Vitreimonas sp.]|nr:dual specificity protein phosphatase [Vitreimonas sp.]